MENIINPQYLENTQKIRTEFIEPYPFKHVLLENFLTPQFLKAIREEFPNPPPPETMKNEYGGYSKKHVVQSIRDLGPTFEVWDDLLQSAEFIAWVSAVTGIEGLIYDPEYHGAGTHNNLHGQSMDVHIDFNYHRTTGYHRRLNLIVYISEEWDAAWGGSLELHKNPWDPDKDEWKSYPSFGNNAVFFETNEISWHGFEEVNLPEDKRHLSRKSLTVYYYSVDRPANEIGPKHTTVYVPKPMPAHIEPGKVLTEKQYRELKNHFLRRNFFLKALYDREARLLQVIDNQKYMLNQYIDAHRLPTLGFVKQIGQVKGLLPSMVVNADLVAELEPVKPLNTIILEGYVPPFVNEGKNTLQIKVDESIVKSIEVEESFNVAIPLNRVTEDRFMLTISAEKRVSPKEMRLNEDTTIFCFILVEVTFE
jgi:hypothetical protein